MHVIAAKAIAFREAQQPEFVAYARNVVDNAKTLAGELKDLGFRIVTGGTDTHLLLIDLRSTDMTGKEAEDLLDSVNISTNRNGIPFDTRSPALTSGLRLGTPAVTTRGMGPEEMKQIARLIHNVLSQPKDEKVKQDVLEAVAGMVSRFPTG